MSVPAPAAGDTAALRGCPLLRDAAHFRCCGNLREVLLCGFSEAS